MRIRISQTQIQKQILAPSMQQSIEMLLLPITDLQLAIDQELQGNPLLEMVEIKPSEPERLSDKEVKDQLEKLLRDQGNFFKSFIDNEIVEDRPIKREDTLEDRLLRELHIAVSTSLDLQIGEFIIGNLDEDGYLTMSLEEIADLMEIQDLSIVENILTIVQSLGPSGIASRDLRECLLLQIPEKFNGSTHLAEEMVQNCLEELGHKKYYDIAKKLGVSLDRVKETVRRIATLEPRPARNFRPLKANIYIHPDIFITKCEENEDLLGYQIHLNKENIPTLRVNPMYKAMLKNKNLSEKDAEFIRDKLRNALHFMRSIEQRGQTIKRIAQYIVDKQKDFLEQGCEHLVPMCLRDVAQELDRNESTISRAINNKFINTPQGLFPMKFFFSQGVGNGSNGGNKNVSNRSIKEELRRLIDEEDKQHPLSDQKIKEYFENKGTCIARRTISKYRQALHILPTHLRKQ